MKNIASILILLAIFVVVVSCNLSKFTDQTGDSGPVEKPTVQEDDEIQIADDEIVFDDANKYPVTKVEFNKIEQGMTYQEVVKILRQKGEMLNSSMVGDYKIETYRWKGDAKYSSIKCTFRNGLLTIKEESNLR